MHGRVSVRRIEKHRFAIAFGGPEHITERVVYEAEQIPGGRGCTVCANVALAKRCRFSEPACVSESVRRLKRIGRR